METASCPITGSKESVPFLQVPDRFDRSGVVQWKLVQSTASGLIMLNPRPEKSEAPGHYRSASYDPYLESGQGGTARQRLYLAARKLLLGYRASLVLSGSARADRKLSILEIGCSTGDLLNHLHKRRGIPAGQLAGIEPDGQAAAYARNSCRITVCSSVGESKAITGPFDRIVLWHALEHIQDLHETIVFAAERLKKDGELVVALPNPASADAAHYRENWIAWDAPRHLWHFTPDTLEKLLERHGLSIWKRLPYLPDALYNTLHSEKLRSRRENRPFTVLSIGRSLLKAAAFALKRAADPSKASTLVYWARKA